MSGGRPKFWGRPLVGRPDTLREMAHEALRQLPECNLTEKVVDFLSDLVKHYLALDQQYMNVDLPDLLNEIEADSTIPTPTKVYLRGLIHLFGKEEAQGRMQIRAQLGEALIGKPPEAQNKGRSGRRLPDGRTVVSPVFGKDGVST